MHGSNDTEEQIACALKQAELGTAVADVCRKMGISEPTFFCWTQKHGDLGPSELRRLKQPEEENTNLKRLVTDFSLDEAMLQDVLAKSLMLDHRRGLVCHVRDTFGVGARRGCRALRSHGSSHRDFGGRNDQAPLRQQIREITAVRIRYGYPRVVSRWISRTPASRPTTASWKASTGGYATRA